LLLRHEARNEVIEFALTPSDRHARSIGEGKANVKIQGGEDFPCSGLGRGAEQELRY
jgi:hypothetical protein